MLQMEGRKARTACTSLNNNSDFKSRCTSLANSGASKFDYLAEHVLMRDLLLVFVDLAILRGGMKKVSTQAQFALVYLYEMLQGKDMSEQYDLAKLNELATSSRLTDNVNIVMQTSFFPALKGMEDQFILLSILTRLGGNESTIIGSFLNRIASLVVKADATGLDDELKFLTEVAQKVSHPKDIIVNGYVTEVAENDSLELVLAELEELIGLQNIKKNVSDLTNFLKVQKIREEKGLKTTLNSLHAVFMGPPGTGKTTVARMLGRIYKHLGYLEKGHLVETDRVGLVAGYVGQTAIKADEIIKSALGGVLFIDEAYSLAGGSLNDFGNEAIEIVLKRMEDHRREFVVVVAGYPDEMTSFLQTNPGLQSRFNRYFEFDHYDPVALMAIFKLHATKADFVLTPEAEEKLNEILEMAFEKRHKGFGNARVVRNLFEKIVEQQANRIILASQIDKNLLITLTEEDIPEVLKTVKEIIMFDSEE